MPSSSLADPIYPVWGLALESFRLFCNPTSPLGDRWFRGTLCPESLNPLCPSILNPSIPQSLSPWGVYPFPTLPRGPRTGGLLGIKITFRASEPFQEESQNQSIFSIEFEPILVAFWLPTWSPQPPTIMPKCITNVSFLQVCFADRFFFQFWKVFFRFSRRPTLEFIAIYNEFVGCVFFAKSEKVTKTTSNSHLKLLPICLQTPSKIDKKRSQQIT